jgi:hypothetical protein
MLEWNGSNEHFKSENNQRVSERGSSFYCPIGIYWVLQRPRYPETEITSNFTIGHA